MFSVSLSGLRAGFKKLSSQFLIALGIVGVIAFIGLFLFQQVQIRKMDADLRQKKTLLGTVEERNNTLQQHLDFYNSPGYMLYVEKVAREGLGLAKPGETVILTVADKTTTAPQEAKTNPTPEPTVTQAPKKPGWQNWFGFFSGQP